jgi:hypothetical protein
MLVSVKIENVSTTEFMIDRHADCIDDARFVAQRKMLTRSELVAMGYDKNIVDELKQMMSRIMLMV